MTRLVYATIISATLMAILLLPGCTQTAEVTPNESPLLAAGGMRGWNIVLLTIDAVDPARLGTYGGRPEVTPYLDKLAREGIVVDHAYCPTGSTAPSHASMLTGLLPARHGCLYNGLPMAAGLWTLPAELLRAGYQTIGCTPRLYMSRNNHFGDGFNLFSALTADIDSGDLGDFSTNRQWFSLFEKLIEGKDLGAPFFVWIHLAGGHSPIDRIDPAHLKAVGASAEGADVTGVPRRGYYDSKLNEMDDTLRHIVNYFDERTKKLDQTLFIIVADHGESFDHGFQGDHWTSAYESTMGVPLVFWSRNKDFPKGMRISDGIVVNMDISPSLLRLLGLADKVPPGLDAMDIFSGPRRKRYISRSVSVETYLSSYCNAYLPLVFYNDESSMDALRKVRSKRNDGYPFYIFYVLDNDDSSLWKTIMVTHPMDSFGYDKRVRFYNVSADPAETIDLLSSGEPAHLDRWSKQFHDLLSSDSSPALFLSDQDTQDAPSTRNPGHPTSNLDQNTIQNLRDLGYF